MLFREVAIGLRIAAKTPFEGLVEGGIARCGVTDFDYAVFASGKVDAVALFQPCGVQHVLRDRDGKRIAARREFGAGFHGYNKFDNYLAGKGF